MNKLRMILRPLRYVLSLWPIIPALILAMLIAFTLMPEQLAPRPPTAPYPPACDVIERNRAPSAENLLGTDYLGCDILSMMIYETRPIIVPLALSLAIGALVGLYTGAICGYFEGFVSKIILRANNIWLGVLVFSILFFVDPFYALGYIGIALLLFISCLALARKVPLGILTLRTRNYIHRARRRGIPILYIVFKSVIPRTSRVILVISVLSALFIIYPYVVALLSLGITSEWMEWYEDTSDWLMFYSPITRISMYVWFLSPSATLILLAAWLRNRLPRFPDG